MKVTTPSISWHNRERISSIDFQGPRWPNDKYNRLASGGDDKHVVIWDFGESLNCLTDLSRHQNSVNVVRWSKDGKVLASGDTDSAIYLWHFQDHPLAPDLFGDQVLEDDSPNENWSVWKILRGHLQDVVSLDWSSCGSYIISSSTDNTAIVFDVQKGTKLKILSEHKGWVNGVIYDPIGKYVASICSDRSLRVYDTKSYKTVSKTYKCKLPIPSEHGNEEKGVRLFHDDTFQSFYRRLDFSPDGQLLVVPSGVLEIEHEASISHCTYVFSRTNFAKPVLYLPNKEFSVAVRFCPILFELRPVPNEEEMEKNEEDLKPWEKYKTIFALPYRMIYAVATQNTVMFYDTQQSLPFARVSKIHYIGLTDLSWSADGHTCIVSSTDGYASFIEFQKGELGKTYSPKKKSGLEEISVNVPIKAGKGSPDSKVPQSNKTNGQKTTQVKRKSDVVTSQTLLPSKEVADMPDKKSASIVNVRKEEPLPKKEKVPGPPSPQEKSDFSSDKCDKKVAQFIAIRKAPKCSTNQPKDTTLISTRKEPRKVEDTACTSSNKDGLEKVTEEPSDAKLIAVKRTPGSKSSTSVTKELVKPCLVELVKTPPISSSSLPSKSPKRVQLVTLSRPEKENDDSDEEEDFKLFLEDDKSQESSVRDG